MGSYISGMTPLFSDELGSHRRLAVMATLTEGKAAVKRRAAGGILEWHVGYHCHTNSASLAHIFHESPSSTPQLQKDSKTVDEDTQGCYLRKGPAVEKV